MVLLLAHSLRTWLERPRVVRGIDAVVVNGTLIRRDNKDVFAANDRLPGRLLRGGKAA